MKAPRLQNGALKAAVVVIEGPLGGLIKKKSLNDMGLPEFRAAVVDDGVAPAPVLPTGPWENLAVDLRPLVDGAKPLRGHQPETVADFVRAYASGATTPTEVASRLLDAVKASDARDKPLRVFISQDRDDVMRQAEAATARWKNGAPLSVLDGVPVAIKDEVDMIPYPTTVGTKFLGTKKATDDATSVRRLRDGGALLTGKTNMHEIGISPLGINPHHGQCRNPHNTAHDSGGSSSGVAASVAAGFSPVALGADGGGSIRIPASFCGVVGLKPTYGRVSEHGAAPLCWTVGHLGPIGQTAVDCAIGYALMSGRDERDAPSQRQPSISVDGIVNANVKGTKLGVFRPWFDDADSGVKTACHTMLTALQEQGAVVVDIDIPDLHLLQMAHVLTIVSEMRAAMSPHLDAHRRDMGIGARMILSLAEGIPSTDYVHAQRIRAKFTHVFARILETVDVIVSPTNACTAPAIDDASLPEGVSDVPLIDKIMRFVRPGNFNGLPAISFVAGYDDANLPVGFQAMGRPWDEARLLGIAHVAESLIERRAPEFYRRLLDGKNEGAPAPR